MDLESLSECEVFLDELISDEVARGCFGAVYMSKLNGAVVVVKRLGIFTGRGGHALIPNAEWKSVVGKFIHEIRLHRNQRHPNIVQFLGVHGLYGDPCDIGLVMENMDMDLRRFMDTNKSNIPLSVKLSILKDTANGVTHLHSKDIVHRDLNAYNVLLTSSLQAKIADLGVARIVSDQQPQQGLTVGPGDTQIVTDLQLHQGLTVGPGDTQIVTDLQPQQGLTIAPGAVDFMPPEALAQDPKYGPKLDCFSFGHLSLYLANEEYPKVFEFTVENYPVKQGEFQITKRSVWLEKLGNQHPLYHLIRTCLHDDPKQRWEMKKIGNELESLMLQHQHRMPKFMELITKQQEYESSVARTRSETDQLRMRLEKENESLRAGHVDLSPEQEEPSAGRDDKSDILREEVERLQNMVIQKDEELTELNEKMKEQDNVTELKDQATKFVSIIPVTKLCKADVGVQFNYASLETDHLQGVTISRSKLFTVHGDQPQSLIWDGHGFELHLPPNTCLPTEDCEIMVDAVVGGEFVFPKGVEPVSAIYIISVTSKLRKPSLLKIQHCVAFDKASKHSRLSFYRALLKEPRPPYHFRRVKGGKFDITNQFGELELPAFCSMAIGKGSATSSSGDESSSDTQSVEGNDMSSSSSGISDMKQKHPIVPEDSAIDSSIMYFGQVFYLKTQLNEWQMNFIVVKHIEAFTSYVKSELKQYEKNVQVNMRFSAPHVELVLDGEDAAKGWSIEPYLKPLVVSLKCASSFGYEKVVAVPPTCMVDVFGDNSVPDYAKRLCHPVLLRGALIGDDGQEPEIFIKRTMAEKDDRNPVQSRQSPVIVNTTVQGGTPPAIDTKAVISCIKDKMNENFADLKSVFENSLEVVSAELFASGLISDAVKKKLSYDAIIADFLSGLAFKKTLPMIIQYCKTLFSVFYKLGGPFAHAGDSLKQSIVQNISYKLNLDLSFD